MEIIEEKPELKSKIIRIDLKLLEKNKKSLQSGPQLEFPQHRKVKRLERPSKFKRKF